MYQTKHTNNINKSSVCHVINRWRIKQPSTFFIKFTKISPYTILIWWLRTSVHNFFPCAVEISFLHTKVCGNAPFKARFAHNPLPIDRNCLNYFVKKFLVKFKDFEKNGNFTVVRFPRSPPNNKNGHKNLISFGKWIIIFFM